MVPQWVMSRQKRGFTPPLHGWHKAIFAAHGATLNEGLLVAKGVLRPESAALLATGPYPPEAGAPMSFKALTLELWSRRLAAASQADPSPALKDCVHA